MEVERRARKLIEKLKGKKLPNLFIVGAPKCGTTSLYEWLRQHPNVYMSPVKEPMTFAVDYNGDRFTSWREYLELFQGASASHVAVGEASPVYLSSKVAVSLIEEVTEGRVKYIVCIRNPVDMAFSLFYQYRRNGWEDIKDFYRAWCLSPERRKGRRAPLAPVPKLLDYQEICRLGTQLGRLLTLVDRNRVHVVVMDDLARNPWEEWRRILNFLSLDNCVELALTPVNEYTDISMFWVHAFIAQLPRVRVWLGIPRTKTMTMLWKIFVNKKAKGGAVGGRMRPHMPPEVRKELTEFYRPEIELLERILARNLSEWKAGQNDR